MRFSALVVAGLAAVASAAPTPEKIANDLLDISQKVAALQGPAESITAENAALITVGRGPFPQIISGFAPVISDIGNTVIELGGIGKKGHEARGPGDDLVLGAYVDLTRTQKTLLKTLTAKKDVLAGLKVVGPPVATTLREVQNIDNLLASTLSNEYGARAPEIKAEAGALNADLDVTIRTYDTLI